MSDSDEILFDDIYELHEVIGEFIKKFLLNNFYQLFKNYEIISCHFLLVLLLKSSKVECFYSRQQFHPSLIFQALL